ncbi:NAD(+) hydrolase TcpC-like [Branchiostoma floridae x Branchiostoma belcheri]
MEGCIKKVVKNVGYKWEDLARELGFKRGEIQTIQRDLRYPGPNDKCREMLERWIQKKTSTDPLQDLKTALDDIDERLTADSLGDIGGVTATPTGAKVFLSHASEDKEEFVEPLVQELLQPNRLQPSDVFYDKHSLKPGDDLWKEIDAALRNPALKLFVFVISRHVLSQKKWPQYEYQLAYDQQVQVFPIWLEREGDENFSQKVSEYDTMRRPERLLAERVHVNEVEAKLPSIAGNIIAQLRLVS